LHFKKKGKAKRTPNQQNHPIQLTNPLAIPKPPKSQNVNENENDLLKVKYLLFFTQILAVEQFFIVLQ